MTYGESLTTSENGIMLEAFEWYVPADQKHWQRLSSAALGLSEIGINIMWIPPGCKASSPDGNGYDIYDLYDLGEFNQKGSRSTKWGPKEDLMHLVAMAEKAGIGLCWDAVLNHKAAADHTEKCKAVEVDPDDRTIELTKPYEIEAWLGFDFPGRGDIHSSQKYHWHHFSGTDFNAAEKDKDKKAIYKIVGDGGKDWSDAVANELGNYDYLMFADIDYSQQEVKNDVKKWFEWIAKEIEIKAVRFDAVKHYSADFLKELLQHLDQTVGSGWFLVGEFWRDSLETLTAYLERMDYKLSLFDTPLVHNFSRISMKKNGDLRKVFHRTLVKHEPANAVTLVMNHDTQPNQALDAPIKAFFKPLAYALILLRSDGYPCVFYGDLYGIKGDEPCGPSCRGKLPDLCLTRKLYAYGQQNDYFNRRACIGWTREGTRDHPYGLACVMGNAGPNLKRMYVGKSHCGEVWTDVLGWEQKQVTIDRHGNGLFPCLGLSVSVFVNRDAEGRDRFGKFDSDIYKTQSIFM